MKTQVVSFVYVNMYVLYNNSCGCRWGGEGEGIQEYKPNLWGQPLPKMEGNTFGYFCPTNLSNQLQKIMIVPCFKENRSK